MLDRRIFFSKYISVILKIHILSSVLHDKNLQEMKCALRMILLSCLICKSAGI